MPLRETNVQGLLLEEIQTAAPEAYEKRTKRQGIVNAFMDENFAQAIRDTGKRVETPFSPRAYLSCAPGKKNLIVAGVTTDVCLVPPALSMQTEGFHIKVETDNLPSSLETDT